MQPGGTAKDWEHLVNIASSTLTELKNLVKNTSDILDESQAQSQHAGETLKKAQLTLVVAVLTLLVSVAVPVVIALIG